MANPPNNIETTAPDALSWTDPALPAFGLSNPFQLPPEQLNQMMLLTQSLFSQAVPPQEQLNQALQAQAQLIPPMFIPPLPPLPAVFTPPPPQVWHPDLAQSSVGRHSPTCLKRFLADVLHLVRHPQPGADVFPDEDDATLVEFLLRGAPSTPYEGGFFHFSVRATPEYPAKPPLVILRTTGLGGRVRFNPNFYENGCVCLSLLGTWPGPDRWHESYRLENLLHALQFRMNHQPLENEPALLTPDSKLRDKQVLRYTNQMAYETLRVAVCEQLETGSLPTELHRCAARYFVEHYQQYRERCAYLRKQLDGKSVKDFYHQAPSVDTYEFAAVYRRLEKLLPIAQAAAAEADEE